MPNLTGVLLLLVAWALVELTLYIVRRRTGRRGKGAKLAPSRALALRTERRDVPPVCVVLVHGLAGFGELSALGKRAAYFRGVRDRLEARGIACVAPRLPPVASIDARARVLANQLAALGDVNVMVIAHSRGGLDARFAIARYAPSNVRALVTVATPHRGTPIADIGAQLVARSRLVVLARALADLAPSRVEELNAEMPDAVGVRYGSVLVSPRRASVHPLLLPTHRLLASYAGHNDGLVPVLSQAWGDVMGEIDTDHWGAIGWGSAFDAAGFYASLVEKMRGLYRADPPLLAQRCA